MKTRVASLRSRHHCLTPGRNSYHGAIAGQLFGYSVLKVDHCGASARCKPNLKWWRKTNLERLDVSFSRRSLNMTKICWNAE